MQEKPWLPLVGVSCSGFHLRATWVLREQQVEKRAYCARTARPWCDQGWTTRHPIWCGGCDTTTGSRLCGLSSSEAPIWLLLSLSLSSLSGLSSLSPSLAVVVVPISTVGRVGSRRSSHFWETFHVRQGSRPPWENSATSGPPPSTDTNHHQQDKQLLSHPSILHPQPCPLSSTMTADASRARHRYPTKTARSARPLQAPTRGRQRSRA